MVRVACDLCGEQTARPCLTPATGIPGLQTTFSIVQCAACGLLYTCPRPAQACMPRLYSSYYTTQADPLPVSARQTSSLRQRLRPLWHRYCGQYLTEVIGKARGAVLEIGCGTGDLLEELAARGCRVHGVDINPVSVRACRQKGLPATVGELDDLVFPADSFDTVILWHVVEHLPSPRAALEKIRRLLRPGGRLFLYCPNAGSYLASLFGACWYAWQLPFHFYHFTPATMRRLAQQAGFSVVRLRTITPEYLVAYSLDLWGRSSKRRMVATFLRSGLHRTLLFRLAISPLFRLLDWWRRGQGECLQVELMKPEA